MTVDYAKAHQLHTEQSDPQALPRNAPLALGRTLRGVDNNSIWFRHSVDFLQHLTGSVKAGGRLPLMDAFERLRDEMASSPTVWISPATCQALEESIASNASVVVPPKEHIPYPSAFFVFAEPLEVDQEGVLEGVLSIQSEASEDAICQVGVADGGRASVCGYLWCGKEEGESSTPLTLALAHLLRMLADDSHGITVSRASRPDRRRAKRANRTNADGIHVIYDKANERREHGPTAPEPGSSVRAHRRRAHMRRQPYGPLDANPRPWRWKLIPATVVNPDKGDPDAIPTVHRSPS